MRIAFGILEEGGVVIEVGVEVKGEGEAEAEKAFSDVELSSPQLYLALS